MLDTAYPIETPEGVSIHLTPAGPVVRLLAWLIDFSLRAVLFMVIVLATSPFGELESGLLMLAYFTLDWLYYIIFEMLWRGKSPGKAAFGLVVLREDGQPLTWSASFIRNIMRAADFMPALYVAGLLSMVASQRFQRLGDMTAGTLVVYASTHQSHDAAASRLQLPTLVQPKPPSRTLAVHEQQAMVELLNRSAALGMYRTAEIAELVSELVTGSPSESLEQSRQRLLECAAWVSGQRPEIKKAAP